MIVSNPCRLKGGTGVSIHRSPRILLFLAGLASTGCGARAGYENRVRVGGRFVGPFCRRQTPPAAWRPDRDADRLQISPGSLSATADPCFLLDASQRPAQPPQRVNVATFLFAHDIAHVDRGYTPSPSMSSVNSVGRLSADPWGLALFHR